MSDTDDLRALQQAALSVQDMRDAMNQHRADQIVTTEVRQEGFYWVILGQNPPEIAYWERGELVAGRRSQAVAPGGGDRRQRAAGVQAEAGACRVMPTRLHEPKTEGGRT
jgi:hypothetical protein